MHDLELATVVLAPKLWKHYLYRTHYKVFTDHHSWKQASAQVSFLIAEWDCSRVRLFGDRGCPHQGHGLVDDFGSVAHLDGVDRARTANRSVHVEGAGGCRVGQGMDFSIYFDSFLCFRGR